MANITKDQFDQVIDTFTIRKDFTFRADDSSKERKHVTGEIKFEGATINKLAQSCLSQGVVVQYQNGYARKHYDQIPDRSVVKINWSAPASAPQEDGMTRIIREAKAAGVNVKDKKALEAYILDQVAKLG